MPIQTIVRYNEAKNISPQLWLRVLVTNADYFNKYPALLKRCVEIAKQFLPLFQGNYSGMQLIDI